jgi:ribosomal protein L7/L12
MHAVIQPLAELLENLYAEDLNSVYERAETAESKVLELEKQLAAVNGLVAYRDLRPFFVVHGKHGVEAIPTIKAIRELTGVGLKEAKGLYDRWSAMYRSMDGSILPSFDGDRYDTPDEAISERRYNTDDNPFLD